MAANQHGGRQGDAKAGASEDARRLRTADLEYELPESAIATQPARPRDSARLLVIPRSGAGTEGIDHRHVRDLPGLLRAGDLLVVNDTRVMPARFGGHRRNSGGKVEGLYLGAGERAGTWRVLLKMRRQKAGVEVSLHDRAGEASGAVLRLIERCSGSGDKDAGGGAWVVEVVDQYGKGAGDGLLERVGLTPLPPYILAARRHQELEVADEVDRAGYQTVYSRGAGAGVERGSVAAPTAGLHFTPALLARLEAVGVERAAVTLEVGLGTFKPVEAEFVEDHAMHAEWCVVPRETARAISRARGRGGRVIAVGTTSARVLESFASAEEMLERGEAGVSTRILITPGYRFRNIDGLMTNFHLPRSTLMAMVAAFVERDGAGDGVARLRGVYREALDHGYRFYSYGDAMIVL